MILEELWYGNINPLEQRCTVSSNRKYSYIKIEYNFIGGLYIPDGEQKETA